MIKYFIDGVPHYLIGNKSYTEAEYEKLRAETAAKDEQAGYKDRMAGYYDKWYRYNRLDEGAAYDRGQRKAVCSTPNSTTVFVIIECAH